ncbi:MAG: hypothetical protein EG823_00075 [Actinobacteria bacterium]|nr:hypothetical protein [Actinomycetota bacterium]
MSDGPSEPRDGKFAVLDVFGITLEVTNPRLAELLTMDATDALATDVRDLVSSDRRAIEEALPDVVISMPTPHSEQADRARREFRSRANELAGQLGFDVDSDGTWESPRGIDIVMRTIERPLTAAAAAHYVTEVAAVTDRLPESSAVLFVVVDEVTAEAFKLAIRQRKLHHLMRTVAIDTLEQMAALQSEGRLDHRRVLVLLAPIADINVGEMLSVLTRGGPETSGEV